MREAIQHEIKMAYKRIEKIKERIDTNIFSIELNLKNYDPTSMCAVGIKASANAMMRDEEEIRFELDRINMLEGLLNCEED